MLAIDWPATVFVGSDVNTSFDAACGVTVIVALPGTPLPRAEIVACPALTDVTRPVWLTVATALFDDAQKNVIPVRTVLSASRAAAANCCVAPSTMLGVPGRTVTVATAWSAYTDFIGLANPPVVTVAFTALTVK